MARFDVSILAAGRDVSNARLQRVMASCVGAGLSVELFSCGNKRDLPAGVTFHSVSKGSRMTRLVNSLALPWRARGKVLFTPDPEGSIAIWLCSFVRKRPWVADVREDYSLLIEDRVWAQGARRYGALLLAKLAIFASARADVTVVVDDWIRPLQAKKRLVVRNAPDIRFLPDAQDADVDPRALYVGDVRGSRGLWSMLRTLEMAPEWHLDIVGTISSNDIAQVLTWKEQSSASGRVKFHGTLKPEDAWKFAAGAWVGLSLLENTPAFQRAWPTKIGEYLACGIPVITTDLPRPREVIISTRAGASVDFDTTELTAGQTAGILNSWAENRDKYAEVRARARAQSEIWRHGASYDLIAEAIRQLI
ncbi:MAG TPA: glycosyltransferase [archaeon]|nr:glycosyltransferase [archaeon]